MGGDSMGGEEDCKMPAVPAPARSVHKVTAKKHTAKKASKYTREGNDSDFDFDSDIDFIGQSQASSKPPSRSGRQAATAKKPKYTESGCTWEEIRSNLG